MQQGDVLRNMQYPADSETRPDHRWGALHPSEAVHVCNRSCRPHAHIGQKPECQWKVQIGDTQRPLPNPSHRPHRGGVDHRGPGHPAVHRHFTDNATSDRIFVDDAAAPDPKRAVPHDIHAVGGIAFFEKGLAFSDDDGRSTRMPSGSTAGTPDGSSVGFGRLDDL
jgi:hypothetical protein